MKKTLIITLMAALGLCLSSCVSENNGYGYEIKDGVAVYNTPARPADQQSMLGFTVDPIDTVRVGFIGLGDRGDGAVNRFTFIDGVKIVALCDIEQERVEDMQKAESLLLMHIMATERLGKNSAREMTSTSFIS